MGKLFKGVVLGATISALFGSWLKKPQGQQVKQAAEEMVRSLVKRSSEVAAVTKESYIKILDTAMAEVRKMKSLSEHEASELRSELETRWEEFSKKA